jgi:hypothetical protein
MLDERMLADVDLRHRHLLKKGLARLYLREDESQTARIQLTLLRTTR